MKPRARPGATPAPAGRAPNEALRARWGLHQPAQSPPQEAPDAQAPAQESAETPKTKSSSNKVDVTSLVKGELPDAVIAVEQKSIRWLGRTPEDPADTLKAKFDEAFEKLSTDSLPKIELAPLPACLLLAGALWVQMFLQGEKMEPRKERRPASIKGSADATGVSPTAPTSPENSSRPPDLRVVEPGSATGATGKASDD